MLNSYKLLSHPKQLLKQHLHGVADIALKTHLSHDIKPELNEIIYTICLCHDFGKCTQYFQNYIRGNNVDELMKSHSLLSAIFTYWMLPERYKIIGFLVVKAHHGDIKNIDTELNFSDNKSIKIIKEQIKSINNESLIELNDIYRDILKGKNIEDFIEFTQNDDNLLDIYYYFLDNEDNIDYKDMILCQYIYSLLLTGDKSQLILKDSFIPKEPFKDETIFQYKEKLIKESLEKNPKLIDSHIFKLRNEIYEEMVDNLKKVDLNTTRIFSINVPTGTGKTILSYQASFFIANKIKELNPKVSPSIIYTLPFTSVIDQNHKVLLDILTEFSDEEINDEDVLKFHSVTPIKYKNFDGYDARFCFENWQSRIISTTFIQLFNTIFKVGDNSIANRFHKLANSVVILDEIQTIDTKYFKIIEEFLNYISKEYNIYFILVTATMPLILNPYNLIPNNTLYFKSLNRIRIENYSEKETTIDELKNIVSLDITSNPNKSFLIILNTVKSSQAIFKHLKQNTDRKVIYLSTEIYPKHRLEIIDKIKNSKEKYIVVSTQLIEAGVDIDMDVVYRDLAPLDSINQSAGRCNRNGIENKGVLKLYKLIDVDNKNAYYNSYIYPRPLIFETSKILKNKIIIDEKDFLELNQEYFKNINSIKSNQESNKLLDLANKFEFKEFRERFNLIDNNQNELIKTDIVVNINDETNKIINKIKASKEHTDQLEFKNLFRELRKYTVSVPTKDINERKINYEKIEKYNILYIDKNDYTETGIKRFLS